MHALEAALTARLKEWRVTGPVLAAVSGGADSMALLLALCHVQDLAGICVHAAHVEHGIRGKSSLRDADFVTEACRELGVPLHLCHLDVPELAKKQGTGVEEAAREGRYRFLFDTAEKLGARIMTAHHRRDQAETVLMHLLRGSDIAGLAGMSMQGRVLRPFLDRDPEELRAYLKDQGQAWCEDETNQDTRYSRNAIRHVLPELEKIYPGAVRAIWRLARAAARDEAYFEKQIMPPLMLPFGACTELSGEEALKSRQVLGLLRAAKLPETSLAVETGLSLKLGQGADITSGRLLCRRGLLFALRPWQGRYEFQGDSIETPFGSIRVEPGRGRVGDGKLCQAVPQALLEGAYVAKVRMGPFQPLGSPYVQDMKKVLSALGLGQELGRLVPALLDRDGNVLWLPGLRPSERCRVRDGAVLLTCSWGQSIDEAVRRLRAPGKDLT